MNQRLRTITAAPTWEGLMEVQDSSAVQYAGFWARVAAYFVDFAIIMIAYLVLGIAGLFGGPMMATLIGVLSFFLNLLYWPVMEVHSKNHLQLVVLYS